MKIPIYDYGTSKKIQKNRFNVGRLFLKHPVVPGLFCFFNSFNIKRLGSMKKKIIIILFEDFNNTLLLTKYPQKIFLRELALLDYLRKLN